MLKKIILGIVALLLLVGAENLLAMEKKDKPKAKQKQEQVQKGQKKQTSKAKTEAKKARAKKAKAAAARKHMEARRGKPQQLRPGQVRPMQEGSGRLLDELTKAYRENDREKMGQLLRKMHQTRKRLQQKNAVATKGERGFRGRPGPGMQPSKGVGRPRPPMSGRGMGRRGQGFQGRGMGGWGRGFQGRGMGGPGRDFRGRGMGGRGQGFPVPWCPWLQDSVPEMD